MHYSTVAASKVLEWGFHAWELAGSPQAELEVFDTQLQVKRGEEGNQARILCREEGKDVARVLCWDDGVVFSSRIIGGPFYGSLL